MDSQSQSPSKGEFNDKVLLFPALLRLEQIRKPFLPITLIETNLLTIDVRQRYRAH